MAYKPGCKITDLQIGDSVRVKLDLPRMTIDDIRNNRDGTYTVTMTTGLEFIISTNEEIRFPRRTGPYDPKIWPREGRDPIVNELACGDILVPNAPEPPQSDQMEWLKWKVQAQTVTRLYHVHGGNKVAIETVSSSPAQDGGTPTTHTHMYVVSPTSVLTFPRPEDTVRRSRAYDATDLKKAGPYVDVANSEVTYFFYIHPTGRGRWPSEIDIFERRDEPGEYEMRPPQTSSDWKLVEFAGSNNSQRHPSDMTKSMGHLRYVHWRRQFEGPPPGPGQ